MRLGHKRLYPVFPVLNRPVAAQVSARARQSCCNFWLYGLVTVLFRVLEWNYSQQGERNWPIDTTTNFVVKRFVLP